MVPSRTCRSRAPKMEDLLPLFGVALLALLVAVPILAWLYASRVGRLERDLHTLSRRLDRLRRAEDPAPKPEETSEEVLPPPPPPPVREAGDEQAPPAEIPAEWPAPTPDPRRRLRDVEWERWIGVRGAAVLGGAVAALAAILLFQHAIQEGWLTPSARVTCGATAGALLLLLGQLLRRRGFAWVPSAVTGAGIVALYATIWAADERYGMIGVGVSFPLMAAVTALACVLALRQGSLVSAVIGLVGGFATPILLSSGSDRPLSLFGYVLLLDLGLLFVGQRRRWPSIGLLALAGTVVIEALWIPLRMGPERLWLGLVILGAFALLFVATSAFLPESERRRWLPAQAGGLLFPFLFALYFAEHADLRGHIYPTALLLALLAGGAFVVGRAQRVPRLPLSGALACVAVVGVWLLSEERTTAGPMWELTAVVLGLVLVSAIAAEWERARRDRPKRLWFAQAALGAGWAWMPLAVVACARATEAPLWPLLVLLVGLAVLSIRQAWLLGVDPPIHWAALATAVGMVFHRVFHLDSGEVPHIDPRLQAILIVGLGLGFFVAGLLTSGQRGRAFLQALGIFLVVHVLDLGLALPRFREFDPWLFPFLALVVVVLLAVAATRLRSSVMYVVTVLGACLLVTPWVVGLARHGGATSDTSLGALVFGLVVATLLTAWPVVFRQAFTGRDTTWRAAGVASLLLLPAVDILHWDRIGDGHLYLPPLLLGLVVFGAALPLILRARAGELSTWRTSLAWYGAVGLFLLALVLPRQLAENTAFVTIALWAAGLAILARSLGHIGLAWLAAVVIAAVSLTLVQFGLEEGAYAVAAQPVVSWIGYTNLVPAASALAVALALRGVPDLPSLHPGLRVARRAIPPVCTLALFFLWLNLEIVNHFATGEDLRFDVARHPVRDVTMSVAWGVYALVVLVLGTARRASALRWTSLALFVLTFGKVFLYDLGHLEGLYRVASLGGLALSLIVVSLLYQRFVFRK